ncbi:hypothetical protein BDB00DRAFT_815269 [Zychaea mexicana]|uniref:uncharacterized protein n=1 Tax=Zychaea mexicana TaxID=64656 RepID=UPI0022FE13B2|nr:uncharacterized protein BDB00DRAFT_815269 [Zychaea mexicana]KAI9495246.1 hypothetical protein BDB00DRAFT_815269 [Zychaea mexicana]
MEVYDALREQAEEDAHMTLKSMGMQLCINVAISIVVILCVSYLRPRHFLAYPSSKASIGSTTSTPTRSSSSSNSSSSSSSTRSSSATSDGGSGDASDTKHAELGWSDWLRQLAKVSDDFLIDGIGYDAVLYLRFMRTLRNILIVLTIIALAVLMPINVAATRITGDWPPVSFDIGFLSISGINFRGGQEVQDPDQSWYLSPVVATWFFTAVVVYFLHRATNDYIAMRKKFCRSPAYSLSSRSLLVSSIPAHAARSDVDFKSWLETRHGIIQYPIEQVWLGRQNSKLLDLVQRYQEAVYHLEDALAAYAKGAPGHRKRPSIRIWKKKQQHHHRRLLPFPFCLFQRGETMDAIDYYTKQVSDLNRMVRLNSTTKKESLLDYGWVTFRNMRSANNALKEFKRKSSRLSDTRACISPPAKDIFWSNMSIPQAMRALKVWLGRGLFVSFMVIWLIPIAILSALSNMVNMIRMYPESRSMIEKHSFVIGLIQAYITPLTMAFLFYILPHFFRYLAMKQGYLTRTARDSKVLAMLYIFFLINHLLMFTISSMFIGLYGQLRQLVLDGILGDEYITEYVAQLAKNMSDVSSFWINLYCIRAFGVSLELVQVMPVLMVTLRKYFMRLTPRRFKKLAMPPNFDFALNYNIVLFFFTIALVYSSTAPLVLPFALVYFVTSSFVYKYMLMYIYVTKTESGGRIWPTVLHSTIFSTIVFQLVSFLLLLLKGGYEQGLGIIPLPMFTLAFQWWYGRRLKRLTSSEALALQDEEEGEQDHHEKPSSSALLQDQYRNPLFDHTYLMPVIHDDMRSLLTQIYPNYQEQQQRRGHRRRSPSSSSSSTNFDPNNNNNDEDIAYHGISNSSSSSSSSSDSDGNQPFGMYPTNPDFHVVLHDPVENRSVVFHTVTDDYYTYDQNQNDDYCPCCHGPRRQYLYYDDPPVGDSNIPIIPVDPRNEKALMGQQQQQQHLSPAEQPSAPPLSLILTPSQSFEARRKSSGPIEEWRQRMDVQRSFQPAPAGNSGVTDLFAAEPSTPQTPELPTYLDAIRSPPLLRPVQPPLRRHSDPSVYNANNSNQH